MSKYLLKKAMIATAFSLISCSTFSHASFSQNAIAPDNTLPSNTLVNFNNVNKAYTITGGTQVGVNQFHSFQNFSVPTGNTAHFDTLPTMVNVISRVTGLNVSNIDGLIKANGSTNLYLINPNGIVFGKNAKLEIGGSFGASTANSFKFTDGSEFSATNPQAPPLLNVNVPLGLQYGKSNIGATINNQGNLLVEQDLVLNADKLDLQGSLQSGRDLALQAQDLVKIRDTVKTPFFAVAGRDLLVQGDQSIDIFTLNNVSSGFWSGRNIMLRSLNPVIGDARFYAGKNLKIEKLNGSLGNLISPNDPVIFANGDVDLGDYTGASLHILAGGSVTLGDITIDSTGTQDTTINPRNTTPFNATKTFADLATFNLTDYKAISNSNGSVNGVIPVQTPITIDGSKQATLDVRSGVDWSQLGGVGTPFALITVLPFVVTPSSDASEKADITVNGIWVSQPSGLVLLTNQYRPNALSGTISVKGIDTSTAIEGKNGGDIRIYGRENISLSEAGLFSASTNLGNGGTISLSTNNGDISIIQSLVLSGLESFSDKIAGNGGTISLSTNNGDILLGISSLDSFSSSPFSLNSGNGGAISLFTNNGDISLILSSLNSYSSSFAGNAGNGGAISLSTNNGNISLDSGLRSYSVSFNGNSGNGGAISLSTNAGNIGFGNNELGNPSLDSYSFSSEGNSANAGDVIISAIAGNILGTNFFPKFSVSSFSVASTPTATSGNGGNVTFNLKNSINDVEIVTISSSDRAGNVLINGSSDLTISNLEVSTSKTVSIQNPINQSELISFEVGKTGRSGDVTIASLGSLTLGKTIVNSATRSSDPAGNIVITSPSLINFQNNSQIQSSTNSIGNAGNISFSAPILNITDGSQVLAETNGDGAGGNIEINTSNAVNLTRILDSSPVLSVQTSNGGKAGSILINTPTLTLSDQARITATSTATSTNTDGGGSVTLNASSMNLSGTVGVFAETESSSNAGTLKLSPYMNDRDLQINLTTGSKISASTLSSGNGGNIELFAPQSISITGSGELSVTTSDTGNAGNISFNAPSILLTNGVLVSASTSGIGKGGDIKLGISDTTKNTVNNVTLSNGARIDTATFSSGESGTIVIIAGNSLILDGNNTGLFAKTEENSTGNGGSIIIDPPLVSITNGAGISVDSLGKGNGGDLTIFAGKFVFANNAFLRANTASGEGGNISLQITDIFFPRNNSSINATAGGIGNGGNINLSALFTISLPSENNDIFANASFGKGGNINLTTQAIFGLQFRPRLTPLSDITASSEFGVQGNVNINTPEVDPSKGLSNLPTDVSDASRLVKQECIADKRGSSFTITGKGGVPAKPSDRPTDIGALDNFGTLPGRNQTANITSIATSENSSIPERIVEATGWIVNAQQQVVLISGKSPAQVKIPCYPTKHQQASITK